MTASLMIPPKARFFNASGTAPLAGGKVYTYEAGLDVPKVTYTTYNANVENQNPVILDSHGEANIWLDGNYKIVLKDANDVTQWTVDNVQDINLASGARKPINSAITYYVNPSTGSDSNTGLTTNTAWATIQYAVNYVAENFILNDARVTIQLADGTYSETVVLRPYVGTVNYDPGTPSPDPGATFTVPTIRGNSTTPANVKIASVQSVATITPWAILHCEITNNMVADWGALIYYGNIKWSGTGSAHLQIIHAGSKVELLRAMPETISGGAALHILASAGGEFIAQGSNVVTFSGTPTFSTAFVAAVNFGILSYFDATFSGTFIGPRYYIINGTISSSVDSDFPPYYPGTLEGIRFGGLRYGFSGNDIFYVSNSGSDTLGDGSSAHPWRTIQHAVEWILQNCDTKQSTPFIQLASAGTYTENVSVGGALVGGGRITILGSTSAPSTYILSGSYTINGGAQVVFNGLTATSGNSFLTVRDTAIAYIGTTFISGAITNFALYANGGTIYSLGGYTIAGSGTNHLYADNGGVISVASGATVTVSGTPAFTAFANASNGTIIVPNSVTFSGSATGSRYNAVLNGVINTYGGGATFLPGNSGGTTATGGQYA